LPLIIAATVLICDISGSKINAVLGIPQREVKGSSSSMEGECLREGSGLIAFPLCQECVGELWDCFPTTEIAFCDEVCIK